MNKLALATALAASVAMTGTAANASITIQSITPGTSPYSGPAPYIDFDSHTTTTIGGTVETTSGTSAARPYGASGNFYAAGPTPGTPGIVELGSFSGSNLILSFIWGSVDWYNTLEFLNGSGGVMATFHGNDIYNPADGNQTDPFTNPVVAFNITGADITNLAALRLTSSTNAFEIDNIAALPEPGTWAMMILGFGAIGFAMRRRRVSATALPQLA